MRKFSWYTIVHPDWQEGQPPLFRRVGPAILPDEHTCDIYFKPNRKGGHTHFHCLNAKIRKDDRRKIKRKFKKALLIAEFSNIMCLAFRLPFLYNLDPKRINQINRIKKGGRTWLAVARNPAARNRRKSSIRLDARMAHG